MSDSPFAEFAAGAAVVREGEPARAMYIIESGRVEIRSSSSPQPLAELGPGEVIGEMALLQEQPHSATATARTAVRALCIDQAAFHAVLRENPEVAVQLMRQLVLRLRAAEQRSGGAGPRPPASAAASPPATASTPAAAGPARPAAAAPAPAAAAPATPLPAAAAPTPLPPAPQPPASQRAAEDTGIPPAASPLLPTDKPAPASVVVAPAKPAAAPAAGPAPPAAAAPAAASGARWCMRHAQGEISLSPQRDEWLIGRPDPATGQVPEIDLGALDVARSLSRRHARLRREGAQLLLREEPGVANGTWVNGERLAAGAAVPLRPGDRLRFGAVEVEFVAR